MNYLKIKTISAQLFISLSILSLLYVSILSLFNPQATMELVDVTLTNTDAISSIRGIYGGVGLVICISLIFLLFKNIQWGLAFLSLFWSAYAISRILTIFLDGPLGDFGNQWLSIELFFAAISTTLLFISPIRKEKGRVL